MTHQLAKFQFCRLCLASFIDRFRKHNDDVIMSSFMLLLAFEDLRFSETLYRLSFLQASNLLVIWIKFYGG